MAELTKVRIKTTGMHCHSCAMLVQMSVTDVEGVDAANVDVATGTTEVSYDPALATTDQIVTAIKAAGYGATVEG